MLMSNFLKDRKSVREYKNKPVDQKVVNQLMEYAKSLEDKYQNGFRFVLFKNGAEIYSKLKGKAGYSGVMIKSPHYIGLEMLNDNVDNTIKAAYAMESLISKSTELNLGTCWVSMVNVENELKKDIYSEIEGEMDFLLAFGYPIPKNPFKEVYSSSRLPIDEIVFDEEIGNPIDLDKLEVRGLSDLFYYVRFAPSSYNSEPWRFILKNNKVVLTIKNLAKINLTDAGIIMYYFEGLANSMGINSKWNLLEMKEEIFDGVKYTYIGEFDL